MKGLLPWLFLLAAAAAPMARSHEVRPAYLGLKELGGGEFEVVWKVPTRGGEPLAGEEPKAASTPVPPPLAVSLPRTMPCGCPVPSLSQLLRGALPIHPALPAGTRAVASPRISTPVGAEIRRWRVSMPGDVLEGGEIKVHGLETTLVDVLVRIELADGRTVTRLLQPDEPSFVFRADEAGPAPRSFFAIGAGRFLLAPASLLLVLGTLLLARGWRGRVESFAALVISFGAGLAVATFAALDLPLLPIEAVLALGVAFLAADFAKRSRALPGASGRATAMLSCAVGLLLGFQFAPSFGEAGVPENAAAAAFGYFFLGGAAGMAGWGAAIALSSGLIRRLALVPPPSLHPAPAYGVGAVASCWFIGGVAAIW